MRTVGSALLVAMVGFVLCGCRDPRSPSSGPRVVNEEISYVRPTMAAQEIAVGTVIQEGKKLFASGKMVEESKAPAEALLWSDKVAKSLTGKKVKRALRKGETVKRTDIVEADGSPLRDSAMKK